MTRFAHRIRQQLGGWLLMLAPVLAALAISLPSSSAAAGTSSYIHVVRPGDTLASIAQRFYGDPRRENVLVAENGLTNEGGSAIVIGMRLVVPWVQYHRVQEGETWQELADRYYGDARRAFAIVEANRGTSTEQPSEGAQLLVPYPLRHITAQGENVSRVARLYYARDTSTQSRRLRRFNRIRGRRLTRGQVVLVPLADLVLSEGGRRIVEEHTGAAPEAGESRARQENIQEQMPTLREHVRRGRFTEAVVLGSRLLGAGVTVAQSLSIQRELGTAYVALGRQDLAVEAFASALRRQPDLELDGLRTSPTVMAAFQAARQMLETEAAAQEQGGGADQGPAEASADAGADEE